MGAPSGPRLLRLLVAVATVSLTSTIALLFWMGSRHDQLHEREGKLLATEALQQHLLATTSSDQAIAPHADPEIGFVLNPAKRTATWWAAEGDAYAINSLGLRGPEIGAKPEGVTRVLLVGDSVVFGWRIRTRDRIGETMDRIIAEGLGEGRVEVVSVALPSWNIRSEVAFLRRNMHRLEPDLVVWNLLRNDIQDMAAAVPPGVLGAYASPHRTGLEPFTCLSDFQYELPMPSIKGRWIDNLEMISELSEDFNLPGLLLSWMPATRAHIEILIESSGFGLPVLHLPGFYRYHEHWALEPADPHPTPWATRAIAVGLVAGLLDYQMLPAFELTPEDREFARIWSEEASNGPLPGDADALLNARIAMIPSEIDLGDPTSAGIVYGVRDGWMAPNGLLVVRSDTPARALDIDLLVPTHVPAVDRHATLTLRSLSGDQEVHQLALAEGRSQYRLGLPPCTGDALAWEMSWSFGWARCDTHQRCVSARGRHVELSSQ